MSFDPEPTEDAATRLETALERIARALPAGPAAAAEAPALVAVADDLDQIIARLRAALEETA